METKPKVVFLVGRDNWQNDVDLNQKLFEYLNQTPHEIVWEDEIWRPVHRLILFQNQLKWLPSTLKTLHLRLFQISYAVFHWDYLKCLLLSKGVSVHFRANKLKKELIKLGETNDIIVLSRSAGGRFASLIADELVAVKHIICLGYPFQHPGKSAEPERYLHLKNLKTPMSIIQGDKDEYGGIEIQNQYELSPAIDLVFMDADHEFNVNEEIWKDVIQRIDTVLN
ncbi:alpha/beta family hydrolase [Flavobacterium sp. UMI-01]|uniref:alpha/beta family hydrolase n=1 Tax=Flavobacterium sp. UMI-01 TaxID=1441053 RepID=UPI001C7DD2EB|nr:alpha/beta family hydrolase [Flavobacterium sp. UMI-01]GIZ07288.1 hypothetical protein FUMI01_00150 [Flavobacterium sp. UMI-01]